MSNLTAAVIISCVKLIALSAIGVAIALTGHYWVSLLPVAALAFGNGVTITSKTTTETSDR